MKISTQNFQTRQHMIRTEFEIFHYSDKNLNDVQLHHHDFYEVYLFLSGRVTYSVEGKSYVLKPHDILLIAPNELHQALITPNPLAYERVVLWIDRHFLKTMGNQATDLEQCFDTKLSTHTNLLRLGPDQFQQVKSEFMQLFIASREELFGSKLLCQSYIQRLMILLNRHILLEKNGDINDAILVNDFLEPIISFITEHLSHELPLDWIANHFYMSKFHLMREFKRQTGTTIHQYILQKRLALSKQLILKNMPINHVFLQCGFNNYSHFFRSFKSQYDMTPKQFYNFMHAEID